MASADGVVEYPLQVTGVVEAAKAFSLVDQSLAKNALSQEKFAALLEKSTKRHIELIGKQSDDALVKQRLGIDANAKSANGLRAKIDELAAATKKQAQASENAARAQVQAAERTAAATERAAKQSAAAVQAANRQAIATQNAFAQSAQRITPAFSAAGAAISAMNPQVAALATAMGRAGGAMSGVTSVLGGPWGIAVGVAVAATGLLTSAFSEAKEKSDELYKSTVKTMEAMRAAQQERITGASSFFSDVRAGKGEFSDLTAQQIDDRIMATKAEIDFGSNMPGGRMSAGDLEGRRDELRRLQEAKGAASLLATGTSLSDLPTGGDGSAGVSVGGAKKKGPTLADRRQSDLARADAEMAASQARMRALDGFSAQLNAPPEVSVEARVAKEDAGKAELAADIEAKKKATDEEFKAREEASARATEAEIRDNERRAESSKKTADVMRQASAEAFGMMGAASSKVLQSIAKGEKIKGKQILAGIGDEMIAKGTGYMFEGLFRLISSYGIDQSGTAMIGVGAGAVAFGMGLGAATRGGAGAGKGGGSSRTASPTIAPSKSTGSQYAQPLTVNVYALEPSAAVGERIYRSTRMAQDQGRIPRSAA